LVTIILKNACNSCVPIRHTTQYMLLYWNVKPCIYGPPFTIYLLSIYFIRKYNYMYLLVLKVVCTAVLLQNDIFFIIRYVLLD